MKRLIFLAPLLISTTGCGDLACQILGLFEGTFGGTQEGTVNIQIMDNSDDETARAEIRLSSPPLDVFGSAVIGCEGGMFTATLERTDGDAPIPDFGDFSGLLGNDDGDGEWSFNEDVDGDGEMEMGTWQLTRVE